MSEDESANAQSAPVNTGDEVDSTDQKAPSYEELIRTNARLLRESQQWKSRAQAKEREKEESEKAQMVSQQEWKKLAEKYQNENKELKESRRRDRIRAAVHDLALRAGCVNVEDLLRVGNQTLMEYDDDSGEVNGADIFVEETRRLKPYLFQTSKNKPSTINSVTPGSVPEKRINASEVAAMKPSDPRRLNAWMDAMKTK